MAVTTAPMGERIDYAATLSSRTKTVILIGVLLGLFLEALDQTIGQCVPQRLMDGR
jgi:cobalamin synthase